MILITSILGLLSIFLLKISLSKKYFAIFLNFVFMKQKTFKKDGKKVILLGMIHVANKRFYQKLKNDFSNFKGLTLNEGVRDSQGLLTTKASYQFISKVVGLSMQTKDLFPNQISGDIDVSELDDESIQKMNKLGKIINNVEKLISGEIQVSQVHDGKKFLDENFKKQLLQFRNQRLIEKIKENINNDKDILIPWGAAHLPEIEDFLKDQGYSLEKTKFRKAINLAPVIPKALMALVKISLNQKKEAEVSPSS